MVEIGLIMSRTLFVTINTAILFRLKTKKVKAKLEKELAPSVTYIISQSKPCLPISDPAEEWKILTQNKKKSNEDDED